MHVPWCGRVVLGWGDERSMEGGCVPTGVSVELPYIGSKAGSVLGGCRDAHHTRKSRKRRVIPIHTRIN